MKHHAEIVLAALLQGHQIELDGLTLLWQDGRLCMPVQVGKLGGPMEDMVADVESGVSLGYFVRACERLPHNFVMGIAADIALTNMARERVAERARYATRPEGPPNRLVREGVQPSARAR